jgi:hypothetical protein
MCSYDNAIIPQIESGVNHILNRETTTTPTGGFSIGVANYKTVARQILCVVHFGAGQILHTH